MRRRAPSALVLSATLGLGCTSGPPELVLPAPGEAASFLFVQVGQETSFFGIDAITGAGLPLSIDLAEADRFFVFAYREPLLDLGLRPGDLGREACRPPPATPTIYRRERAASDWSATASTSLELADLAIPCATCDVHKRDGGDGRCVASSTCSAGYHYGGASKCVLLPGCEPEHHDGGDGECVPDGICKSGFHDGGAGDCVPTGTCAPGFHDGGTGDCVPSGSCRPNFHDVGDGRCGPLDECITGRHDDGVGNCVSFGVCARGYTFDLESHSSHPCSPIGFCKIGDPIPFIDLDAPVRSCSDLSARGLATGDGDYPIEPIGQLPVSASCDMSDPDPGWTLILSYAVPAGQSAPQVVGVPPLADRKTTLGDRDDFPYAGQVSPAMFAGIPSDELRFQCKTSAHERIMDFTTRDRGCLEYAASGVGTCRNVNNDFLPEEQHTAYLPKPGAAGEANHGDSALTWLTLGEQDKALWNYSVELGRDCDTWLARHEYDTIHRIWARKHFPRVPEEHDGGGGGCTPARACNAGYVLTKSLLCVPEDTCEAGQHDGGDGVCVPEGGCSSGFTLDPDEVCFRWRELAPLPVARYWHVSHAISDHEVLVAGGTNQEAVALDRTDVLDLDTNQWRPGPTMADPRGGAMSTELPGHRIVIAGGVRDEAWHTASSIELYDPEKDAFEPLPAPIELPRFGGVFVATRNQKILLAGGDHGEGVGGQSSMILDPWRKTWETGPDLPQGRVHGQSVTLYDGRVVLLHGIYDNIAAPVGGVLVFDPYVIDMGFRRTRSEGVERVAAQVARLPSGEVLVAGGHPSRAAIANCEIWNPASDSWRTTTPLNGPRSSAATAVLGDGRVLVIGGGDDNAATDRVEIFDPETERWTDQGALPNRVIGPTAVVMPDGRRVVVIGGIERFANTHQEQPTYRTVVVYESGRRKVR